MSHGALQVNLSASSPDEQALVAGAGYCGFSFVNRRPVRR
jgi:phospholipid-translocating ATPase/phospholipid-transporting ATPase